MSISITWDDISKLEKLVDRPSKFREKFFDFLGESLYENMFKDGYNTPRAIMTELRKRMVGASTPRSPKKPVRDGKKAAANDY